MKHLVWLLRFLFRFPSKVCTRKFSIAANLFAFCFIFRFSFVESVGNNRHSRQSAAFVEYSKRIRSDDVEKVKFIFIITCIYLKGMAHALAQYSTLLDQMAIILM